MKVANSGKAANDLERRIRAELASISERWRQGIDQFGETVRFVQDLRNAGRLDDERKKKKNIRTAVHGDVEIDGIELRLLDSFYLQRLRNISHMGLLHFIYPEARHSRFEHSLGVLHLAKELLSRGDFATQLSPEDKTDLKLAALLHDIGHGPFSHTSEIILGLLGLDDKLRKIQTNYHEQRACDMFTDTDFQLRRLQRPSYGIAEFLDAVGSSRASRLTRLICGTGDWLASVVNGPVDLDKLDYFLRDTYYTGVTAGVIDVDRLLSNFRVRTDRSGRRLGVSFDPKVVPSILQLLYTREFLYSATVFHPVVNIVLSMLVVAFDLAIGLLPKDLSSEVLLHLDLMDDNDLVRFLENVALEGPEGFDRRILKDIVTGLRSRRLFKKGITLTASECVNVLGLKNLEELWGLCGISTRFATCRYFPLKRLVPSLITGGDQKLDSIAVLSIPYRPEVPHTIREKLTKVAVDVEARDLVPYLDALGQRKSVNGTVLPCYSDALCRLQSDLWRAFVLLPSEVKKEFEQSTATANTWRDSLTNGLTTFFSQCRKEKLWRWRPNITKAAEYIKDTESKLEALRKA